MNIFTDKKITAIGIGGVGGYIVREAMRLHIDAPISKAMFKGLTEKIKAQSGGSSL